MSPRVVSDLDFKSWLVLHVKQDKTKLQFTDCIEKRDFLQMTPNIDILYTVGNHFSQ